MSTSVKISHLRLVYPPMSNQEAYWLRDDPEVEARLRQSDFYLIGGRCEAEFVDIEIDKDEALLMFRIQLKSGLSDTGALSIRELPGVAASKHASFALEMGPKVIRIWDRDRNTEPDAELLEWFTTESLLYERSRHRAGIVGLDKHAELSTFDLFYAGIAKTGDSFDRLVNSGHQKRLDILSNEPQRHPSSRVTDETYLFLFKVESLAVQMFGVDDDFEDFGMPGAIDPKRIVADAEKAFVKLLDPSYNQVKYVHYPKGADGLYGSGLTRYGYVVGEDLTFNTGSASIRGTYGSKLGFTNAADCIFVEGDTVSLHVSGKDFPADAPGPVVRKGDTDLPPRLARLIDDRVFDFATQAVEQLGTADLVVVLDLTDESPELVAIRRSEMAMSAELPDLVRNKLQRPASEVDTALSNPHQSFWLFAIHSEGSMDCVALNASMLAPGGTA